MPVQKDKKRLRECPDSTEQLEELLALAADWTWEQDADLRFTRFSGRHIEGDDTLSGHGFIGMRRWEIGLEVVDDSGWSGHRKALEGRKPFRDVVMYRTLACDRKRYISVSGVPVFDRSNRYIGYRGVGCDLTDRLGHSIARSPSAIGGRWMNEAILRSKSPDELYQQVCDAAVRAGKFVTAIFMLPDLGGGGMILAAVASTRELPPRTERNPSCAKAADASGLIAAARHARDICVSNDLAVDGDGGIWHRLGQTGEVKSCAAIPLLLGEQDYGLLLLYASEEEAFDEATQRRLRRVTQNIAFALHNFRREAERWHAEEALRASEDKYRSVLDSIEDAYYEVDSNGEIIAANAALRRMLGSDEVEVIGANIRQFMRQHMAGQVYTAVQEVFRTGIAMKAFEWEMVTRNGQEVLAEVSIHPIKGPRGEPAGFRGIARDITVRKREERLLALEHAVSRVLATPGESREVLQRVLRIVCESEQWESAAYFAVEDKAGAARLLVDWTVSEAGEPVGKYYAGPVGRIVPPGGLLSAAFRTAKPLWAADVRRDSRSARSTDRSSGDGSSYSHFSLPVLADGEAIGVCAFVSRIIREPDERLLQTAAVIGRQVGQFLQRKQVEQELRASEARFRSLMELSSDWFWEQDTEFRFRRIEGRHALGDESLEGDNWLGHPRWETGLTIEEGDWATHRALLMARRPFKDIVLRRTLSNGAERYISVSGEPVFDREGCFAGYRGVGRDITNRKRAEERIRYLATHDSLTGLPNRALFSQFLTAALEAAQRYERGIAVMFIDLDGFKAVNDTLGHAAGDELLKKVGVRLKKVLRASDILARFGGDEFVALVQEVATEEEAAAVARKIVIAFTESLIVADQECRVGASIGICLYPSQAQDGQSLMKNADAAMYFAKRQGKGNYHFYSPDLKA